MAQVQDFLLMLVLLLGLATLGTSRLAAMVRIVAAQGIALGAIVIVSHEHEITARLIVLAALIVGLKGVVMPWMLFRSLREAHVTREVEPYVSFPVSVLLGTAAVGASFAFSRALPLPMEAASRLIVPVSLAVLFMGFLLLVSRKKAITQVLGYLVLENGVFVFSLALASALPILVEMGILLDIFVGVFVMGIAIYQINREFDHIDSDRLQQLHDLSGRQHDLLSVEEARSEELEAMER